MYMWLRVLILPVSTIFSLDFLGEGATMYKCARSINFAGYYEFLLEFGTVLTV